MCLTHVNKMCSTLVHTLNFKENNSRRRRHRRGGLRRRGRRRGRRRRHSVCPLSPRSQCWGVAIPPGAGSGRGTVCPSTLRSGVKGVNGTITGRTWRTHIKNLNIHNTTRRRAHRQHWEVDIRPAFGPKPGRHTPQHWDRGWKGQFLVPNVKLKDTRASRSAFSSHKPSHNDFIPVTIPVTNSVTNPVTNPITLEILRFNARMPEHTKIEGENNF